MRRHQARPGDEGAAMLMVMAFVVVMALVVGSTLAYATNQQSQGRHGMDTAGALAAAQAGIDDYLGRLNQDEQYFQRIDCDNPALRGPNPDPRLAAVSTCGWSGSTPTGWESVESGDASSAQFHYDIDTSQIGQYEIWITSTGRAGGSYRTLQARLKLDGSTGYVYYTDFEDADPDNTYVYPSPNFAKHNHCGLSGASGARYRWDSRTYSPLGANMRLSNGTSGSYCTEINFITNDKLTGPVHFNDLPYVNGSVVFTQGYGTAAMTSPASASAIASPLCAGTKTSPKKTGGAGTCWWTTSSATPSWGGTSGAYYEKNLILNNSLGNLKNLPGCMYTGDTRIRFRVEGGVGKMDVWNTRSAGTTIASVGDPVAVATAPSCGTAANFTAPATKQTITLPSDSRGLVIVALNSPTSSICTPGQIVNGTASGSDAEDKIPYSSDGTATNMDMSFNHATYTWTRGAGTWGTPATTSSHNSKFDCGQGNVYIEGTVKGRVTIAAEDNVFVTGDLKVDGTAVGADPDSANQNIVGLIAENSVVVYHPVKVSDWTVTTADPGARVVTKARASSVGTLTTAAAHGITVGDTVTVAISDTNFNGDKTVTAVSGNTFSFATASGTTSATSISVDNGVTDYKKVTNKARTGSVATLTTDKTHGFSVGDTITVALGDTNYDGNRTITAVPSATTLRFAISASDTATAAVSVVKGITRRAGTCAASTSPQTAPTGGVAGQTCTYVPNSYSEITTYLSPPTTYAADSKKHRWVYASIQTLDHSFWVEAYNKGNAQGVLSVRGSIAQRWRGIVGTGTAPSTGYLKDYKYDERLKTTCPPYFPPWANSDWASTITGEVAKPGNIS